MSQATSLDGFRAKKSINTLPTEVDVWVNIWSCGRTIKIAVTDFYMNSQEITWKKKTIRVCDYELFKMMVKDWITGSKFCKPITKEQALDIVFDIV